MSLKGSGCMLKGMGSIASFIRKIAFESVELKQGVRFAFAFTRASSARVHEFLWGMCAITFQPLSLRTQLFRLMHFYEF
jgi:hypothetical protein